MTAVGLYHYGARWYDSALGRFIQADSIVPGAGNPLAWDRYAYTLNNPVRYTDPSGHCSFSFNDGIWGFLQSCVVDVLDAVEAYQEGERRPDVLTMHATGGTDFLVETANQLHQLNSDLQTVFSDAPLSERLLPAVNVGSFAVGTAANIVGGVQAARGIQAFSRSGTGSFQYYVEGTQSTKTFSPGDELYRVYGGKSPQQGQFAFTQNPGNQITAIRKGALPPTNTTTSITRISFSGPVNAEMSKVARMFGQPGGFTQVKLPRSPFTTFSAGKPLPLGFIPFVPNIYNAR